ncbi:MAG: glutamate--tRNA ligase family protein [Candidatus Kapaibacteriota bacterium]
MLRSRLAPTPSGYLHLGNAFSFLLTWLVVRKQHGHLHLRIDDLDADRAKPDYYDDIFTTLDWLGLDYDSGARSTDDCLRNWSQKRRLNEYHQALMRLADAGEIFACECSRSLLATIASNGVYPGECRTKGLPLTQSNTAWRVRLVEGASDVQFYDAVQGKMRMDAARAQGDVIVRRRDGIPAYHIASLVDDTLDEITLVVRGADLLPSTAVQIALAQKLGLAGFPTATFLHHALITEDSGKKLSKSHDSLSLRAMRENGTSAEEVIARCAALMGFDTPYSSLQELLDAFSLEKIPQR